MAGSQELKHSELTSKNQEEHEIVSCEPPI
jgi:hypothetical protein